MELEQAIKSLYIVPLLPITLFLYGIGALLILLQGMHCNFITLFLYGIGARSASCQRVITISDYIIPIWNWSYSSKVSTSLPKELENYIIPIWNWSIILRTHLSLLQYNYIIPIWNWSLVPFVPGSPITLFLYGIGAFLIPLSCQINFHYIIPIWNWSIQSGKEKLAPVATLHYSYMELEQKLYGLSNQIYPLLHYSYMELEQKNVASPVCPDTVSITLFLYGIGAEMKSIQPTSHVLITLFLYGIGAVVTWCVVAFINHITLFLYGIGAVVRSPF